MADASAATNGGGGLELHPLTQFEIKPIVPIEIGGLNLSFTNSALWMVIAVLIVFGLTVLPTRARGYVPGRVQVVAEMLYDATANMLHQATGRDGRPFFPLAFTLFSFLLVGNLQGMIPGAFTFTSHIVVTFALALAVFIGTTALGFIKHGTHFFSFFMPTGAPLWTAPLLILIELISYISRPISLSLRLFANMLVGHTMLKVLGGFVFAMGAAGIIPLAAQVAVTALEFLIAVLQAYVFAILSCIYLGDALHPH